MSDTRFTTISWRALYDQARKNEPREKRVAYRFTGRDFMENENPYEWTQKAFPYTFGDGNWHLE